MVQDVTAAGCVNSHGAVFTYISQELQALIAYIKMNKEADMDWFTIAPSKDGTKWTGKCWCVTN